MYDEPKAIAEIKALSLDARAHLQHVYRNGLQSVSGLVEEGQPEAAQKAIQGISHELRRLGL